MLRLVGLVRTDVSEEQGEKYFLAPQLIVITNPVPSSSIAINTIIDAIRTSETLVLTRATRRNFPLDDILLLGSYLSN
jgi:hypothetical protein